MLVIVYQTAIVVYLIVLIAIALNVLTAPTAMLVRGFKITVIVLVLIIATLANTVITVIVIVPAAFLRILWSGWATGPIRG